MELSQFKYISSKPGIFKIIIIFLSILMFICMMSEGPSWYDSVLGEWTLFVSLTGIIMSIILIIIYSANFNDNIDKARPTVKKIEPIHCILWSFFSFTVGIACAVGSLHIVAIEAVAVFGFLLMIVFAYDGFRLVRQQGWLEKQTEAEPSNQPSTAHPSNHPSTAQPSNHPSTV